MISIHHPNDKPPAPACLPAAHSPVSLLCYYVAGIKFFDPEIVGDTPETVEFKGMRNLLDAVAGHLGLGVY